MLKVVLRLFKPNESRITELIIQLTGDLLRILLAAKEAVDAVRFLGDFLLVTANFAILAGKPDIKGTASFRSDFRSLGTPAVTKALINYASSNF